MSKRKHKPEGDRAASKPALNDKPGEHVFSDQAQDGFINVALRLGQGAPNLISQSQYDFNFLTTRFIELEAMYRGSWIVRKAIDSISKDMVRAGITFNSEMTPDETEELQQSLNDLGMWDQLLSAIKWGKLYGGAIAVIMIKGQDLSTPLQLDRIGKNSFLGLKVFIRWQLQPSINDLVETGADAGYPRYYTVLTDESMQQSSMLTIHHSRVIRLIGAQLPWRQLLREQYWGESVVEVFYDRLTGFDAVTAGMTNLVEKSYLRTVKIDGLRNILAQGGTAEENVIKQWEYNTQLQNTAGLLMLNGEDEFSTHNYSFGGLSDVFLQYQQQIAGALGIPLVILLGQSPAGLNATGESDVRFYYDNIKAAQESDLRYGLSKISRVAYASKFGRPAPDLFNFEFVPLWQTSQKEKFEMAHIAASTLQIMADVGLPQNVILEEAKRVGSITEFFNSIDDETIENAKMPTLPGGLFGDDLAPESNSGAPSADPLPISPSADLPPKTLNPRAGL